jgi:hypothetical protein
MNQADLRQSIELKVVELIKKRLEDGTITEERAQELSQLVLDTITPGMSLDELHKAIPTLDDTAPELSPIVLPVVRMYEDTVAKQAEEGVRGFIRTGQYDAAVALAKQTISHDAKVEWHGIGKAEIPDGKTS